MGNDGQAPRGHSSEERPARPPTGCPPDRSPGRWACTRAHIAMWRRRSLAEGLDGLQDAPAHPWHLDLPGRLPWAEDVGMSRSQRWRVLDDMDIKPDEGRRLAGLPRRPTPGTGCAMRAGCARARRTTPSSTRWTKRPASRPKQCFLPTSPAAPCRPPRQELEYRRHGPPSWPPRRCTPGR